MSQSITPMWDPSDVLSIITRANDISCAGITLKGLPCGWRLDRQIKAQVRMLLRQMSEKSPRRALNDLPELAKLCLCEENHRDQAERVLNEWTPLVRNFASLMESMEARRQQERSSSPDNESNRSSIENIRATEPRSTEFSVEDVIAELKALDIRRIQLQRVLQQKLPEMGNPTPISSPIQSPPSSVATPRDESPPSLRKSSGSGSSIRKLLRRRKD